MDNHSYQRGLEAYGRGDYDAALREWRPLAEQEIADAQYMLAMALWHQGANFGDKEVRSWFEKAADQGHADALCELGSEIMEDDLPRSKSWLLAAAEQGHAKACMELCYLEIEFGRGESEGIKWYRRGRELGHPHDPWFLSIYPQNLEYHFGPFDKVVAGVKRRAKCGSREDQYILGLWYAGGTPPFHRNVFQAYAWFVVAASFRLEKPRLTWFRWEDWNNPMRAVHLLEQVLDNDERRLANRLANYYAKRFSPKGGFWRKVKSLFRVLLK